MATERCATCRWWLHEHGGDFMPGQCRRAPPLTADIRYEHSRGRSVIKWPETHHDDWCGEHEPCERAQIERRVYKGTDEAAALLSARFGDGRDCYTEPFEFDGHRWAYSYTGFDDMGEYDLIWRPREPSDA